MLKHWLVIGFWGPFSRIGLSIALATLVADQAHKWWMLNVYHIADKGRVEVLPFLDLVYAKNLGVSYGFLYGAIGPWVFALFAACVCIVLAVWLATGTTSRLMAAAIGLIMGGALGNGLDRITLGGVADFIQLHAYGFYWYIFNIADVAIVAGVIGLLYDSLIVSRPIGPVDKVPPSRQI